MAQLLWICLAGAIGTGVRYGVGIWAGRALGIEFPYGTLIVNVCGSFLIALVLELAISTSYIGPTLRMTLTTGFMGGLTTYSSFNQETLKLLQARAWTSGALYLFVTLAGCLVAGLLGLVVARRLAGSG